MNKSFPGNPYTIETTVSFDNPDETDQPIFKEISERFILIRSITYNGSQYIGDGILTIKNGIGGDADSRQVDIGSPFYLGDLDKLYFEIDDLTLETYDSLAIDAIGFSSPEDARLASRSIITRASVTSLGTGLDVIPVSSPAAAAGGAGEAEGTLDDSATVTLDWYSDGSKRGIIVAAWLAMKSNPDDNGVQTEITFDILFGSSDTPNHTRDKYEIARKETLTYPGDGSIASQYGILKPGEDIELPGIPNGNSTGYGVVCDIENTSGNGEQVQVELGLEVVEELNQSTY